jgi:hypothetical protein
LPAIVLMVRKVDHVRVRIRFTRKKKTGPMARGRKPNATRWNEGFIAPAKIFEACPRIN